MSRDMKVLRERDTELSSEPDSRFDILPQSSLRSEDTRKQFPLHFCKVIDLSLHRCNSSHLDSLQEGNCTPIARSGIEGTPQSLERTWARVLLKCEKIKQLLGTLLPQCHSSRIQGSRAWAISARPDKKILDFLRPSACIPRLSNDWFYIPHDPLSTGKDHKNVQIVAVSKERRYFIRS